MKLPAKSTKKTVDIQDFYAIKIASLWRGLREQHVSFWFLCLYLVFEYIRPQTLYPVIDVLPWAKLSFLLACAAAFSDKSATWVKNPSNGLFITFFIVVLLSSTFSFHPTVSWSKVYVVINWIILYFLFITIVNTEKRFFMFMLLFFLLNFKMSQHGATSFAARGFSYTQWGVTGSPGWFANAADFGIQMNIFVPLAVAFILAMKTHWKRYKLLLFYLLPLTGLLTIVATSSRGTQLATLATVLWFVLKSKQLVKTIALLLVIGAVTYIILPEEMLAEYQTAGDDNTSESRLEFWALGIEAVKDNPALGVGFESWIPFCLYIRPYGIGEEFFDCKVMHNTYLQAASELGVIGFLLYIVMILFMFVLNARARKNAKKNDNKFILYMTHGLDGGLVGYAVASVFISVLFYPIFWMQLAMTVALHQISKQTKGSNNGDKVPRKNSSASKIKVKGRGV